MVTYRLHVEELMRFRRYAMAHLHVWPALPQGVEAILRFPGEVATSLDIENAETHSVLRKELILPALDLPIHESRLTLRFADGATIEFDPLRASFPADDWEKCCAEFYNHAKSLKCVSVLELGSRTRHATEYVARQDIFSDSTIRYTGLDIVEGPNVDVVGDVHQLSGHFEPNSFDLVFSNWVFEHLMMPWRAILEINAVLKNGGEVFINTNQSIGLHDLPWDFWRYSESAWLGLLNEYTGFEILKSALGGPVRITPLRYHDGFRDHEGGAGFHASAVWARKIGEPKVSWPVDAAPLLARLYRRYPVQITD